MASLKLLTFLLFACLCLTNAKKHKIKGPKVVSRLTAAAPGVPFSFIKPQLDASGFASDALMHDCIYECITNATVIAETDDNMFYLSIPIIDEVQYDPTKLRSYCSYAENMKTCVQSCPDSHPKTAFQLAYKPTTFVCQDETFRARLEGIHKAVAASDHCDVEPEKCSDLSNNVYIGYMTIDFNEAENTTEYFDNICKYYVCWTGCAKEEIIKEATADGFKVFKKSLQKKIVAAKETYKAVNQKYEEPESCTDFRNDEEY